MKTFFLFRKFLSHTFFTILNLFPNRGLRKNKKFKNLHQGETCYILGSGPSIKSQDLSLLEGKTVFTQHHFFTHKDIKKISPKYHCIVPKYQPEEYDKDWEKWFAQMEEQLPEETIYFVGLNTKYLIDKTNLKDRTYYIQQGLNPLYTNLATANITKRIMNIPTVLTQILNIALYMGFDKIYLIGMDFSQHVLSKDMEKIRFYKSSPITENKYETTEHDKIHSDGRSYYRLWLTFIQLHLLKKRADKKKQEIINLTAGGYIHTFKREIYEEVVSRS